jgi:thymidylate kinase
MIALEKKDYEKLVITVGGRTGTGKSTVIFIIKDALKQAGLKVEFDGGLDFEDEEEFDEKMKQYVQKNINAINRPIKIKEVQFALNLK